MKKSVEYFAIGLATALSIRHPGNGHFSDREKLQRGLDAALQRVSRSDVDWEIEPLDKEEFVRISHQPDERRVQIMERPREYMCELTDKFPEDIYAFRQAAIAFGRAYKRATAQQ